jgi:hypothetical protein
MFPYYDRDGQKISQWDWSRLKFGTPGYDIVRQHYIRGFFISTVWLGIDLNFHFEGPPIIFETMVFPPGDEAGEDGVFSERYCARYATRESALAGHDQALAAMKDSLSASDSEVMTAEQFREYVENVDAFLDAKLTPEYIAERYKLFVERIQGDLMQPDLSDGGEEDPRQWPEAT